MKWVGYLGLSFAVSFTVLLGFLSDKVYAASDLDQSIKYTNELKMTDPYGVLVDQSVNSWEVFNNFILDEEVHRNFWNGSSTETVNEFRQAFINAKQDGTLAVIAKHEYGNSYVSIVFTEDKEIFKPTQSGFMSEIDPNGSPVYSVEFWRYSSGMYSIEDYGGITQLTAIPYKGNGSVFQISVPNTNPDMQWEIFYHKGGSIEYPDGYEGLELPDGIAVWEDTLDTNWTPDIKLHQGNNWKIELSDYNFFTVDRVAFTCGDNELAPVINWEVWDITDNDNRVLIDTLIYGAPALVTYNAPKIQEDKRYEIVAYYSDCESFNFEEASTKQFTVRKDGTLNPTDYMNVCIMETFPFINIPDCMAEINDLLAVLSFRVPDVNDLGNPGGGGGGQGWAGLVDGCRQLQVLDDWIMSPDVVICPQMPSSIRNVVTPIVTFALALGVITFVVQRQGMRGISG